jgi:hypothetical protein
MCVYKVTKDLSEEVVWDGNVTQYKQTVPTHQFNDDLSRVPLKFSLVQNIIGKAAMVAQ